MAESARYLISRRHRTWSLVLMGVLLCAAVASGAQRPFTVADDIALTHFGDPYTSLANMPPITFSPDGRYFVVAVERGRLDLDRPESELRVYRTADVRRFVSRQAAPPPNPYWDITKATFKHGPIISDLRWTADSSSIAFLQRASNGNAQLILGNIETKRELELTADNQHVTGFDIRDSSHYVYSILSPAIEERAVAESESVAAVATGRSFASAILREDLSPSLRKYHDLSEIWSVIKGRRSRIVTPESLRPLAIYSEGASALTLSPDGHSIVTALPVDKVPADWESSYPPPFADSPYRFRQGIQDLTSPDGRLYVNRFALIDLESGRTTLLVEAPIGYTAGWWGNPTASWSNDGQAIVLANTFLPRRTPNSATTNRPCVAVVTLTPFTVECVDVLKASTADGYEDGFYFVRDVAFEAGQSGSVVTQFSRPDGTKGAVRYLKDASGAWSPDGEAPGQSPGAISVSVNEKLNTPPELVVANPRSTAWKVLWNPNPQLAGIRLSHVSVLKWTDETGRAWTGGLFTPPSVAASVRYPLVLQAHGFNPDKFLPSGLYPTAFAAQALAASGIVVLQIDDCPISGTAEEAKCQLRGYKSAIRQLASRGLVDESRVGIVGFSRTCFYTMAALTDPSLRFQAASITDGVNEGYWQYIMDVDAASNVLANEADVINGARPFGVGLSAWLHSSPEFNIDKVHTPLQVIGIGTFSALSQWEPYAALRYLHRPVDMIVLSEGTHLLSNPTQRLASQGGTVDWFRFWLQDYEDPDRAKADQYKRWRELRRLRDTQFSVSR